MVNKEFDSTPTSFESKAAHRTTTLVVRFSVRLVGNKSEQIRVLSAVSPPLFKLLLHEILLVLVASRSSNNKNTTHK